jgi:hypothetical protein
VPTLALPALLAWSAGALVHWWPYMRARQRRVLAVGMNVLGIAFLIAAVRAEGQREAAITSVVIVGAAQHTATALASASLYYYVLTGVCLLAGFAGVVFGESIARWLRPRYLLNAVAIGWLITVMRFLLEKSAAPRLLVEATGVTWMAPVAGAYFAWCLADEARPWPALWRLLAVYAWLVRAFVALVGVVSTQRGLGSHYDVSGLTTVRLFAGGSWSFEPGSAMQLFWLTLVPQLLVWPVLTVLAGLVVAAASLRLTRVLRGAPSAFRGGVAGASE